MKNVIKILGLSLVVGIVIYSLGVTYLYWTLGKEYRNKSMPKDTLNGAKILYMINEWREEGGMSKYSSNKGLEDEICDIANSRAYEIRKEFSHQGIKKYQEKADYKLSENIISGRVSEEEVVYSWLNSTSHRKAIEKDFKYSCVKCVGNHCVQILGVLME